MIRQSRTHNKNEGEELIKPVKDDTVSHGTIFERKLPSGGTCHLLSSSRIRQRD